MRKRRRARGTVALPLGLSAAAAGLGLLTTMTPPAAGSFPASEPSPSPAPEASPNLDPHPELAERSPSPEPPVLLRSLEEEVDTASGDLATVSGASEVAGDGPLRQYLVEVEEGLPGEPEDFAAAVEEVLGDPRSWGGDGEMSFQRVDEGPADFRVALTAPDTTDSLCAPLQTNGSLSCHQGGRAVINQNRWVSGVPHFDGDMETYRVYVINHEVGHALGHGHVPCPDEGEPAPVMQQQTLGLQGCEPNGWVYP